MYFEFGVNIFTVFVFALMPEYGTCLKCFSCNSKADHLCDDPFLAGYNTSRIVDCSEELSNREFIAHFSKLMGALGVPVDTDDTNSYASKMKDSNKPWACQKVEIDDSDNRVTVRECALLSDIVCDTLRNDTAVSFCDVCNTDYCNNASGVFVEWHLLLTIVLTNIILTRTNNTTLNHLFLYA